MKKLLPLILLIGLIASACSRTPTGDILGQITPPAAPAKGTGTAVGQIMDKKTGAPLADAIVRLAEVHREGEGGVFVLNLASSPGARTDANGIFIMESIPAGEYVMSVGEGENLNDYDVIEDAATRTAKVWVVVADEITDWGTTTAEARWR